MNKNSVLVFVILFGAHVAFVSTFFTKPDPEDYEEANLTLGGHFLSNADQYECVIAGSSMGAKIDANLMPNKAFNLSFTGRGALDGLRLIQHSGAMPRVVLIELNTIYRAEYTDFTAKLTNPYLRFFSRGSHEKPVNYMVELLAHLKRRICGGSIHPAPLPGTDTGQVSQSAMVVEANAIAANPLNGDDSVRSDFGRDALDKIVQSNMDEWKSLPEYYPLKENLDALGAFIATFEQRGISAILFESPCHPGIATSPQFQIIREATRGHQQLQRVPVIQVHDLTEYHSSDGLHLTPASGKRFSRFLAEQVELLDVECGDRN